MPYNWTHACLIVQGILIPLMNPSIIRNELSCLHLINHPLCSFLDRNFLSCTFTCSITQFQSMNSFCYKTHWGFGWKYPSSFTFHLDNGCLVAYLPIINCCIDPGNGLTYIPNCLHLLTIVNLRSATLTGWTIPLAMASTTSPTPQWLSTTTFTLLLVRLRPISFLSCIKLLMQCHIFLLTYILRSSLLLGPFCFSLLITLPIMLELRLALWLLIKVIQLPYGLL